MNKIVIIGGGIAGYSLALKLVSKFDVTIIEKSILGGTCLNTGCIPTKSLLYLSKNKKYDYRQIIEKSLDIVSFLRSSVEQKVKNAGIEVIQGEAEIISSSEILLKNSMTRMQFDKLVLATGSKTVVPEIFRNNPNVLTSKNFFNCKNKPQKLVIVGGGYIGIEFATFFSNLGVDLMVIERESKILPNLPEDLSSIIQKQLENKGVKFYLGQEIGHISENYLTIGDGEIFFFDNVLLASGRKPNIITSAVDISNFYTIGDVAGEPLLAHKAEYDAEILADHLLHGKNLEKDYSNIPSCIFSDPPIAVVGKRDNSLKKIKVPFGVIGKAYCDESTLGFLRLFINENNQLVGAEVVNKNSLEILSALTVIINQKMTCEVIKSLTFMHPTSSEIIKEAINIFLLKTFN
jgi:dihydrolipoamide dehydrogenase